MIGHQSCRVLWTQQGLSEPSPHIALTGIRVSGVQCIPILSSQDRITLPKAGDKYLWWLPSLRQPRIQTHTIPSDYSLVWSWPMEGNTMNFGGMSPDILTKTVGPNYLFPSCCLSLWRGYWQSAIGTRYHKDLRIAVPIRRTERNSVPNSETDLTTYLY